MRKRKRVKIILFIIIVSIIALSILIYNALPNFKRVNQEEIFEEFQIGQINAVMGGERISLSHPIIVENEILYFPIDFVKTHISNEVFWDSEEEVLTITNQREMMRFKPDNTTYELNYNKANIQKPIIIRNSIVYIPYNLIEEKYNITALYNEEENIVIVDDTSVDRVIAEAIKKSVNVRTQANIKEPILQTIHKKDNVMTYGSKDGWTKVRTMEGNIGYVNEKSIEYLRQIDKEPIKEYEPEPIKKEINGKVVMVWDQINKGSILNFEGSKYTSLQGVNVLSPTWLEFADDKGNLTDNTNREYIRWAHSKGYQVWPLMSHNFSNSSWTHEILSSTQKRDKLITELLEYVRDYNVDGINIDIENLQEKTGPYWVQFMRELYPIIRGEGIYVSTDVYVPSPWTIHYNRSEISKVVDYFVIMAYDEHWSGSEEAGSVSSIPWVKSAIESTLDEVPEEKIILGVPFYARIWEEKIQESGDYKLSSRALGMTGVKNTISSNNAYTFWDEDSGQYYAEYEKDNSVYRVWVEEARSMEERVKLVQRYDLAGISGWKLGLEEPIIWDIIDKGLN